MKITDEILGILHERKLKPFSTSLTEEHSGAIMENYLVKAQELYRIFSDEISTKNRPDISLCATDSLSTEAFVAELAQNNSFLIGISYGVFANIYACFTGLLSHPGILPHIGDPANTHCKFTMTDYGLIDFTYDNNIIKANTPLEYGFPLWNYPKDEERMLYATLLCDIAIEFILYHEWAHILGGHIQYLNRSYGIRDMTETADRSSYKTRIFTIYGEPIRKTMEFEADYIAGWMIASLPYYLKQTKRTFFQAYPEEFLSKYDTRDAVVFSILSIFHLFQEVRIKNKIVDDRFYPSPYFRYSSLYFSIYGAEDGFVKQSWSNYNFHGLKEFIKTADTLQFDFLFEQDISDHGRIHKKLLKFTDKLTVLRKHLKNFRISH